MLALLASPAFKSALDFEFLRKPRAAEADQAARLIANLHGVLVNPDARPGAAAAAKRMLLAVLERTKGLRLPAMIVPPVAKPPARPARKSPAVTADADPHMSFPKTARASSSLSSRVRNLKRVRRVSSPSAGTSRRNPAAATYTNTLNFYAHTNHRSSPQ